MLFYPSISDPSAEQMDRSEFLQEIDPSTVFFAFLTFDGKEGLKIR